MANGNVRFSNEVLAKYWRAAHQSGGTRKDVVNAIMAHVGAPSTEYSKFYSTVTQRVKAMNKRLAEVGLPLFPVLTKGKPNSTAPKGSRLDLAGLSALANGNGEADEVAETGLDSEVEMEDTGNEAGEVAQVG